MQITIDPNYIYHDIQYFDEKFNEWNHQYKVMDSSAPLFIKYILFPVTSPVDQPSQINYEAEYHQVNQSYFLIIIFIPENESKGIKD